ARVGIEAPGWNTAAAFFDADGDGWLDLYIAQYIDCTLDDVLRAKPALSWRGLEQVAYGPFGLKGAPDHFFRNVKGRFVDATEEAGLKDAALGFGFAVRAVDIDDDGDLDLYVANGHIYPQIDRHPEVIGTYRQRNLLLENRALRDDVPVGASPETLFRDASDQAGPGFQIVRSHRGVAVGDFDDDGRLDILITALDEPPELLHNEGPAGSWLTVACEVPGGTAIPIGTKVTGTAGGRKVTRDIAAGDSYATKHDPRLHF